MQRYFAVNKNLDISDTDIYHMYKVMRMKVNDKIEVVYDKNVYVCQIKELNVNNVKLEMLEKNVSNKELDIDVTIAISLVSEQKWDYILQKSTELGAHRIIPLELSRTLIKIDKSKHDKKIDRWTKICKEASEQSFRTVIPEILPVMKMNDLIKEEYDLKLVCAIGDDATNLKQILSKIEKCGRILIVIGPEGGITPSEVNLLVENGFIKTSLGNFVLRVETAPLFVLSAINYELMR